MASYTFICMAVLAVCSFSIIQTSLATRSAPTSTPKSLVHAQSEPLNSNNKGLKQSNAKVITPTYPNFNMYSGQGYPYSGQTGYPYSGQGYPYSGQGYPGQGYPYSGQGYPYSGQGYLPNYGIPPIFPTISGPYSYPYSSYNPTLPYQTGPGPANGDASVSSKARP